LLQLRYKSLNVVQTFRCETSVIVAQVSVAEAAVLKGRHFDRCVIPLRIRWYLANNLSLRNLEEMMAERDISVDHATTHR
jgi:putative transposase